MGRRDNLETYIIEATENIRSDRATTQHLLVQLLKEMQAGNHQELGLIAAKYVETLQRSNEQLVKVTALIQKNKKGDQGLTLEDKQDLFDMINSGEPADGR